MNLDKQRIAIAEACGWSPLKSTEWRRGGWRRTVDTKPPGKHLSRQFLPDYLDDLNAMHEAEEFAFIHLCNPHDYAVNLHRAVTDRHVVNATAEQRAEAFLRTIGKWEDDK